MLSLLAKELRQHRGGILGWSLGLGLWGLLATVLYPSIGQQFGGMEFPEFYEALGPIGALGELPGFLTLEIFNFAIPIALAIYAVVYGTATLAGEEDNGTLELLLALPIPRWTLVLTKALAMLLGLAIVAVTLCLSVWIGTLAIQDDMDVTITLGDLALAGLQSWLLVGAFGAVALFLGAYLPHRQHATMVGGLLVAASFLLNSLAELAEPLEPYRGLSLSHYYDPYEILTSGMIWSDTLVLAGVAVVALALALLSFERRNVTVGAWPWQRPHPSDL